MDELTAIGAENGALIVVSADGARYRVPITEALHTALRQNRPAAAAAHRVSPREVQTLIRSGLTAAEVVERTGEPLEYIQRFEGPVLAEREYVVTAARSVPVAVAADTESGIGAHTFGAIIDSRLDDVSATAVRWASRKLEQHWLVTVSFLEGETEREARWTFEPKKSALVPSNHEAQSLSQQSETPTTLIPRLRAVPATDADDRTRFDSGAFLLSDDLGEAPVAVAPASSPASPAAPISIAPARPGVRTAPDEETTADVSNTADLLEALRRRRGEREAAPQDDREASRAAHPSTGSIRIIDIPLDVPADSAAEPEEEDLPAPRSISPFDSSEATAKTANRRGRAAMPSWDEIVFGARPDEDPA
jgi:hypothetical protein